MAVAQAGPVGVGDADRGLGLRPRPLHEQHRAAVAQAGGEPRDVAVGCPTRRSHGDDRQHFGDRGRHRQPARARLGDQHESRQIDPQPLGRLGAELRHADHPAPRTRPATARPAAPTAATSTERSSTRNPGAAPRPEAAPRGRGAPAARGHRACGPAPARAERAGGAPHLPVKLRSAQPPSLPQARTDVLVRQRHEERYRRLPTSQTAKTCIMFDYRRSARRSTRSRRNRPPAGRARSSP